MSYKRKTVLQTLLALLIFAFTMIETSTAQVQIGVFADCQYCDCPVAGKRYYRNSLGKLSECITTFNTHKNLAFVAGLGDLIDRDIHAFNAVNEVLAKSAHHVYHVTGNHDYSVDSSDYDKVAGQLNLQNTYYSVRQHNWLFIFLDGNDLSLHSKDKENSSQAQQMLSELQKAQQPNAKDWNGGIGKEQIYWLQKQLEGAQKNQIQVALFCHYPLLPFEAHALWNSKEVVALLNKYSCVKAWINGHNHAGNYTQQNGIHYLTLQGMVDTENENAYSLISFGDKKIEIEGIGREKSRILILN